MANAIQMIDGDTFFLEARGNQMWLSRVEDGWSMRTVNASVKAWNNGFAIPKRFDSLEEVEKNYKSWRGVAALLAPAAAC